MSALISYAMMITIMVSNLHLASTTGRKAVATTRKKHGYWLVSVGVCDRVAWSLLAPNDAASSSISSIARRHERELSGQQLAATGG